MQRNKIHASCKGIKYMSYFLSTKIYIEKQSLPKLLINSYYNSMKIKSPT